MAVQILTTVENSLLSICENYGLNNLIRQPTFYKNPSNPVCIDLILTNVPRSFQSTYVVENHLPKTINYRSYQNFSNEKYGETLINNLSQDNFLNNDDGFQRFCHISLDALNKHAPRKFKHARGNQMPFFKKELSKAIITRTKLQKIFLQNRSEEIQYVLQNKKIFVSLF